MKYTHSHLSVGVFALAALICLIGRANAAEDSEKNTQIGGLGALGGDMNVKFFGRMMIEKDDVTGEVSKLTVSRKIHLVSTQFELRCDYLTVEKGGDKIIATGYPVMIKRYDTTVKPRKKILDATCQKLEVLTEKNAGGDEVVKYVLTGKPIVKDESAGDVSGDKITVSTLKGKTTMIIDSLSSDPGEVNIGDSSKSSAQPAAKPAVMTLKNAVGGDDKSKESASKPKEVKPSGITVTPVVEKKPKKTKRMVISK